MIPLCKKLETYHPKGHDMSVHGTDGPIHVSDGGFGGSSGKVILRTIKEMGLTDTADMVDFAKADRWLFCEFDSMKNAHAKSR